MTKMHMQGEEVQQKRKNDQQFWNLNFEEEKFFLILLEKDQYMLVFVAEELSSKKELKAIMKLSEEK